MSYIRTASSVTFETRGSPPEGEKVRLPSPAHPLTLVPLTPTAMTALETSTTAPASFSGAVQIAGGGCCIGGYAGETIQAEVSFSAASPFDRVSKMRVASGCTADTELEDVDWEAFADSKTYPVFISAYNIRMNTETCHPCTGMTSAWKACRVHRW